MAAWLQSGGALGGPEDLLALVLGFAALALGGAVIVAAVAGPAWLVRAAWRRLRTGARDV